MSAHNGHAGSDQLSRAVGRILSAPFGQQHATLNAQAYVIGGHVGAGRIEKSDAEAELRRVVSDMPTQPGHERWSEADLKAAFRAMEDGARGSRIAIGPATNSFAHSNWQTRPTSPNATPGRKFEWIPVVPPPPETPKPTEEQMACDTLHEYCGPADERLFFIRRFEAKNGRRKYFKPLVFGCLDGRWSWHDRGPPSPMPLFGLNRLSNARPEAIVIVHEGEKKADEAQQKFPEFACVGWPGGADNVKHVDLSPLAGRPCIGWSDNDAGGRRAMKFVRIDYPD